MTVHMTGRGRLWAGAAPLVVAGLMALAACSSPGKATPDKRGTPLVLPPPSVGAIPMLDSVRGLTLPSEAYRPTPAQRTVVDAAIDKLIADCVSQFGFTWRRGGMAYRPEPQMPRMYGIGDMERAKRYGYHELPEERADPALTGARDAAAKASSAPTDPEFLLVLNGNRDGQPSTKAPGTYRGKQIPVGGCAGQANREVTGPDQIDPSFLAGEIGFSAYGASKSDARVVAVVTAWSACMKESGYSYPSPGEATAAWDLTSATIGAEEIQTAVTDMACKQRTNLIGTWYTIQVGYEDQLIQQNIQQLNEIMKAWEDAARKATQILGGTAPR